MKKEIFASLTLLFLFLAVFIIGAGCQKKQNEINQTTDSFFLKQPCTSYSTNQTLGEISIILPKGALPRGTQIGIIAPKVFDSRFETEYIGGCSYGLFPAESNLSKPATISLKYLDNQISGEEADLRIIYMESGGIFLPIAGTNKTLITVNIGGAKLVNSLVNKEENTVNAQIAYFGDSGGMFTIVNKTIWERITKSF